MSQRTRKVSSLIQQIVAAELMQLPESARLTVTKVDVTPDLRQATAWVGVVAAKDDAEELIKRARGARDAAQKAIAAQLQTKFVPKLTIERDTSGEYAEEITRLIRGL